MSVAADRALYGLTYWQRAGDQARMRELAAVLDPDVRAEAAGLLHDVRETLFELPEAELTARMLGLAGKSRRLPMNEPQEITTILPGGYGAPPVIVRDHGAWVEQVAAEKRAKADAEIKAAVDAIARAETKRALAPRPPLVPADPVERMHAEWKRQAWLDEAAALRDVPRRQAELEAWAAKVQLERQLEPPAQRPGADEIRRARDNEYSFGLKAAMARATECGHRSCMPGNCVYG